MMAFATQSIAHLFGDCLQSSFKEDLQQLECCYTFKLTRFPLKETVMAALPQISERDSWRLLLLNENGDDLFDLRKGNDLEEDYNIEAIQSYNEETVRLVYTIEKKKNDGFLTIYDLPLLKNYFHSLAAKEFYNALHNNLQDYLVLEIWGDEVELFSTESVIVVKKGDPIPSLPDNSLPKKRINECGKYCQWVSKLPALLPEDMHIVERKKKGALANMFDQLCLLLSACFVADFSSIEKDYLKIRIAGFKSLAFACDNAKVSDLSFDEKSVNQWFDIYDWCYTGGYISDRLTIARNILSLNCPNYSTLHLNDSTLDAIKSNFRIFEQDNVRQYIKVRNDVSKDLLDLQDRVNSVVEGFTGDFRKNIVGLGTFFLTLVVVRVVANGQWAGAFSNQIVALSFIFVLLSAVLLIFSRRTLEWKEKLYTKHYDQLKERYQPLLSKEESNNIFEDCDPNKVGSHKNYIQWQKKCYTWIWIGSLVVFTLFFLGAWCYNLFESTKLFKILKAIYSCCIENI